MAKNASGKKPMPAFLQGKVTKKGATKKKPADKCCSKCGK